MKKTLILFLALPFMFFLHSCHCAPDPIAASNAVTLRPQETNVWCWAAVTQMITEFLGHGRTQCDLANQRFGQTNCCSGTCQNKTATCTQGGWTMFNESNFNFTAAPTALSWDFIKSKIDCSNQPLALIDGPLGGGMGHVRVIYGYMAVGSSRFLLIRDPWAPCNGGIYTYSYDDYVNNTSRILWETEHSFVYHS